MLQGQTDKALEQYQKAWKNLDARSDYRRLVAVKLAALGFDPEETPAVETKK